MMQPGIEPRSPGPWVNTLTTKPISIEGAERSKKKGLASGSPYCAFNPYYKGTLTRIKEKTFWTIFIPS